MKTKINQHTSHTDLFAALWHYRRNAPQNEAERVIKAAAQTEYFRRMEAIRGPFKRGRLNRRRQRDLYNFIEAKDAFFAGADHAAAVHQGLSERVTRILDTLESRNQRASKLLLELEERRTITLAALRAAKAHVSASTLEEALPAGSPGWVCEWMGISPFLQDQVRPDSPACALVADLEDRINLFIELVSGGVQPPADVEPIRMTSHGDGSARPS
jgi:hypothetical protein